MKLTNKLNLPESFVNYSNKDGRKPIDNRYSVTELLQPIRSLILSRKYYNEIEVDVSDCIPALFGTAVHQVLENNTPVDDNLLTEQPLFCEIDKFTLSGRIDLLNLNTLSIEDYKTCSVSKIMKQDFNDWRMQGLMYAYLVFKEKGIILKHLKFYALMKDWSKVKAASGSNYPNSAVYVWNYEINDSDYDYIETWLKQRLYAINDYLESDTLPDCDDEDRWYTGTKYAVYKNAGDKRAAAVCDTEEEAHGYITNKLNGTGQIEVRKGEYLKCKYYCDCCKFCDKRGE